MVNTCNPAYTVTKIFKKKNDELFWICSDKWKAQHMPSTKNAKKYTEDKMLGCAIPARSKNSVTKIGNILSKRDVWESVE